MVVLMPSQTSQAVTLIRRKARSENARTLHGAFRFGPTLSALLRRLFLVPKIFQKIVCVLTNHNRSMCRKRPLELARWRTLAPFSIT